MTVALAIGVTTTGTAAPSGAADPAVEGRTPTGSFADLLARTPVPHRTGRPTARPADDGEATGPATPDTAGAASAGLAAAVLALLAGMPGAQAPTGPVPSGTPTAGSVDRSGVPGGCQSPAPNHPPVDRPSGPGGVSPTAAGTLSAASTGGPSGTPVAPSGGALGSSGTAPGSARVPGRPAAESTPDGTTPASVAAVTPPAQATAVTPLAGPLAATSPGLPGTSPVKGSPGRSPSHTAGATSVAGRPAPAIESGRHRPGMQRAATTAAADGFVLPEPNRPMDPLPDGGRPVPVSVPLGTVASPAGGTTSPTTPAAGPVLATEPDQDVTGLPMAQQLAGPIHDLSASGDGVHRLMIALHPTDLGRVDIRLHIMDGTMSIHLAGAEAAAQEAIRASVDDLHRELAAAGVSGVQVSVDQGSGGSSSFAAFAGHQDGQRHPGTSHAAAAPQSTRIPEVSPSPRTDPLARAGLSRSELDRWL
jgi:flagellar hook-length control protein FliK